MPDSDRELNRSDNGLPVAQPLILTLAFDPESTGFFEAERRRHFPPERNLIPAHLTLFHHLPGADEASVARFLTSLCSGTVPFPLTISGLRFLGRGVAFAITSPDLLRLRATIATAFADRLIPQDRQGFRPHVTIQNKARPDEAKALFARLEAGFEPFGADAVGLLLWRYRDGPWEKRGFYRFAGAESAS